mmetsp:Transcript_118293/g.230102  ORF Transcript_118293/g.230102 Transcript_118293/m.230102 type:complete len:656 (-) Transcript_118293:82-2049(-)
MQTLHNLQCLAGTAIDRASMQRLRDNLQELPKRLLQRHEQPKDYMLGNISGECNYHFSFRLEGSGFFQTGVLVASAERTPGGMPVPLRCKWKRKVGDLPVEISGVTSNMYQISADDVGTVIRVEAQPADRDDGLRGVVVGEIGPFELDPSTRRSLDNALGRGGSRFVTMWSNAPGGRSDLAIQASADGVRVAPQGGERPGRGELSVEYSKDYPRVIVHPLDKFKFQLLMSDSKSFHLVAPSRTARDLIAVTIRCFHAKKFHPCSEILQRLLPIQQLVPGAPQPPVDSRLDSCIRLERLTKELNRAMQQKEVSERVLRNTNNEKRQLQEQLIETISGFTDMIENLESQGADGAGSPSSTLPVETLREHLREANVQTQATQAELQDLRQHLERLRRAREAAEARVAARTPAPAEQARRLHEERDFLEARLKELSTASGTVQHQDQADHVHALELKRLRQDVEMLNDEKENLRRRLQDQDRERQELQDNFLYVKAQHDKVQMRLQQQQATDVAGDANRELQRHRGILNNIAEERSRLGARLELALREAEKDKAYHEQSLERVTAANARIMEERDRAAWEVRRISRLYSDSVSQFNGADEEDILSRTHGGPAGVSSKIAADQEELTRLQATLSEVSEAVKRKEQENESLKNRIRKLAVA